MSKQLVDKLIKQFLTNPRYKRRWDTVLRSQMGGSPHITTITREDLITLYRDNTIAALYGEKSFKDAEVSANRVKGIEAAALAAADKVFNDFPSAYEKTTGKRKGSVFRKGSSIIVRQPKGLHSSVQRLIWQLGWKSISKSEELSKKSRKRLQSDAGRKVFRARTQNLHEEKTTVGSFTLAKLYEGVMHNVVESDFTVEQTTIIANTIGEYFGDITAQWKKETDSKKYSVNDTLEIPLTIGPQSMNPAGSEAYDWKQIRKKLEDSLYEHAIAENFGKDYAHSKGSKPLVEQVQDKSLSIVVEEVLDSVKRSRTVKGTSTKINKNKTESKKSSSNLVLKGNAKRAKKGGIKRKSYSVTQNVGQKTAQSPIALAGLINAKLPDEVAKRMRSPKLVNRTGRFAGSVRVTDVQTTRGGFPSIGYTYEKNPYSVYEVSSGSARASSERDPRPLIDSAIRDIAANFLVGRLYTRRV